MVLHFEIVLCDVYVFELCISIDGFSAINIGNVDWGLFVPLVASALPIGSVVVVVPLCETVHCGDRHHDNRLDRVLYLFKNIEL